MTLREAINLFITSSEVLLPVGKSIEDCIDLFILGQRKAGWTQGVAKKYTDSFPEKVSGKLNYSWALSAMNMKHCSTCSEVSTLDKFHVNLSKPDGKQSQCISCYLKDQKTRPERWRLYSANRKAAKLQATPKWADIDKIKEFYLKCPDGYQVDHIIPLQSSLVCGLHVECNLQYLTKKENLKKSNKFMVS